MAEVAALIEGYRSFYRKYFASGDTLYRELSTSGQSPRTLFVACSDSRVDPSIITNAEPGDIFVVRNVANLIPPYEERGTGLHGVSAALEFAVRILQVKHIVIMGHSQCAGIKTLLHPEQIEESDFIGHWMDIAQPAKEKTLRINADKDASEDEQLHVCEKEGVLLSLENLVTFPWVRERVQNRSLKLHGWHFSIADGVLSQYNPQTEGFEIIPV